MSLTLAVIAVALAFAAVVVVTGRWQHHRNRGTTRRKAPGCPACLDGACTCPGDCGSIWCRYWNRTAR